MRGTTPATRHRDPPKLFRPYELGKIRRAGSAPRAQIYSAKDNDRILSDVFALFPGCSQAAKVKYQSRAFLPEVSGQIGAICRDNIKFCARQRRQCYGRSIISMPMLTKSIHSKLFPPPPPLFPVRVIGGKERHLECVDPRRPLGTPAVQPQSRLLHSGHARQQMANKRRQSP